MKVFLMIQHMAVGGSELQTLALGEALVTSGHSVEILSFRKPVPKIESHIASFVAAGGKFRCARTPRDKKHSTAVIAWQARKWIVGGRPAVVHAITTRAMALAATPGFVPLGIPVVMSRRSLVSANQDRSIIRRSRMLIIRRADLVIANSTAAASECESLERVPRSRIAVIPNILAPSSFAHVSPAQIPTDLPIVVCVANLRVPKNQAMLLASAGLLKGQGFPITVVLVGDGVSRAALLAQGHALGIDVRLVGAIEDVRPYLRAAAAFVQSSDGEGLSNSLLEAMAAGVPIIATDVGGTAEALGDAGVLVQKGNTDQMAAALRLVLSDQSLASALGYRARHSAEMFSARRSVALHEAAYCSVGAR